MLFFSQFEKSWRWESGKPDFGFPLSHPPSSPELWECGNRAVFRRDFQGARGKGGKPAFGFPGFPQPRQFHSSLCRSVFVLVPSFVSLALGLTFRQLILLGFLHRSEEHTSELQSPMYLV